MFNSQNSNTQMHEYFYAALPKGKRVSNSNCGSLRLSALKLQSKTQTTDLENSSSSLFVLKTEAGVKYRDSVSAWAKKAYVVTF